MREHLKKTEKNINFLKQRLLHSDWWEDKGYTEDLVVY